MARPVRFNIHPIEADRKDNISLANMPEGYTGEGFFTTQLSSVVGLARKNDKTPTRKNWAGDPSYQRT